MITKMIIGLMLVMVSFFTGCTQKDPVTLQFRITWDEESGRGDCIEAIVACFNSEHDDITVELIGGSEDGQAYRDALDQGEIDIFVVPYRFLQDEAIASQFQPYDLDIDQLKDTYYESVVKMMQYKNQVLGMPWIGHSMALIYNKDMTEAYKIDPLQWDSLDDLLMGCRTLAQTGQKSAMGMVGADHHDLSWMVTQFIYSFKGQLVDIDPSCGEVEIVINSEASQQALDFYIHELGQYGQDNWQNHTGIEVMKAFANEEIAFEIQGPWGVTDLWKSGNKFDIGVIPLSQIGMNSEVGPLMLSISKTSNASEEARLFVDYMCSEKALNQAMAGEYDAKYDAYYPFRVPIRKDMKNSSFFSQYPEFYPFVMGFEKPSINTPCPEWGETQKNKFTQMLHSAIVEEIDTKRVLEGIK